MDEQIAMRNGLQRKHHALLGAFVGQECCSRPAHEARDYPGIIVELTMSDWLYTLRSRCTPDTAENWKSYVAFSHFEHVSEVVTIDGLLCPEGITELEDEDWNHNVHEDFRIFLFRDLDYLTRRQPLDGSRQQILAVLERPAGSESVPSGFATCGFDIVDSYVDISTLTNCGPMPEIFLALEVNEFGLIPDRQRANEIRDQMRASKPDDDHVGRCEVWRVARTLG